MRQLNVGFTLIELISVLAISALIATSGAPLFIQTMERHRANGISSALYQRLKFARSSAINSGQNIKVCGSDNGTHCKKHSINQILVFSDKNKNDKIDKTDRVFQEVYLHAERQQIRLEATLGRSYIEFDSSGRARQAGSFYYCPKNGNALQARRVTVSLTGRAYVARDHDGDGIIERTDGKPINCE